MGSSHRGPHDRNLLAVRTGPGPWTLRTIDAYDHITQAIGREIQLSRMRSTNIISVKLFFSCCTTVHKVQKSHLSRLKIDK